MKKIILKSLSLVNFRGEQNRTTEFDAKETSIMGDNGIGKSRHFDAFMWLLFGRMSWNARITKSRQSLMVSHCSM